jgi:uncharacterized membrane protein YraQ (UPF0718 family)
MDVIWHGLKDGFLMAWQVWWALVFGFAISAVVQAWVPRERIERALAASGPRPVAWATGLGAASSSCSYAAVAIAKSLFQKGASAASALAFQFASTNLVWELGLVLWVLIGWQFTLAEFLGGLVMIVLMAVTLRLFVSPRLEEQARRHAQQADAGHQHHPVGEQMSWRERLRSMRAWSDVARSACDAVCHSSRFRPETSVRQSERRIASPEIHAWCGRKVIATPTCCALVHASCPTAA